MCLWISESRVVNDLRPGQIVMHIKITWAASYPIVT